MTDCVCPAWHVYWWLGTLIATSFWLFVILIIMEARR